MKRCNFHLRDSQISGLDELSKKTGRSKAEIIRIAINQYLVKSKRSGFFVTELSKKVAVI